MRFDPPTIRDLKIGAISFTVCAIWSYLLTRLILSIALLLLH